MTLEEKVAADPRYRALVRERQRFAWSLSGITATLYGVFIVMIAFDRVALAQPIGGGHTTVAVVAGAAMLVMPSVICAAYVRRANRTFDRRLGDVLAELLA